MATEVILPKLGQTMEEGAIVEWLKAEGDAVQRGDVLFTTESDKATLEVEAPKKGILRRIIVPQGESVPVLSVVALITATEDEDISAYETRQGPVARESTEQPLPGAQADEAAKSLATTKAPAQATPGRIFASPRARRKARTEDVDLSAVAGTGPNGRIVERDVVAYLDSRPKLTPVARNAAALLGVDVSAITGSGPGGTITKTDVEAAATSMAREKPDIAEPEAAEVFPLAGPRRIIAERMAASARSTAQVTLTTEADATPLVKVREQLKKEVAEEWGFAPAYNDLVAVIVARALSEYPYMNARLVEDGTAIERPGHINLGMAVDTERGLLVPVIRNADKKGLREIGAEFRELTSRARAGRALPDDLAGGTFTITNLGMYDIDAFTPIINLPEAAILGVGRILAKPVVRKKRVRVRQMVALSLAFDHRLVDGAPAARFLQRIKQLVENPYLLLA
jgi:pyruvate dehydrogenase E2 component (dihydrolipoamide acetyltransferase)